MMLLPELLILTSTGEPGAFQLGIFARLLFVVD